MRATSTETTVTTPHLRMRTIVHIINLTLPPLLFLRTFLPPVHVTSDTLWISGKKMKCNNTPVWYTSNNEQTGVKNFSGRLKEVIGKQSVLSFARSCNLSAASVRKYLNSGTLPGINVVAAISANTGYSLTWLITGEGAPFSDPSLQKRQSLSDEEITRWLNTMIEALRTEDKINIITAFQYGGLNAVFRRELIAENPRLRRISE